MTNLQEIKTAVEKLSLDEQRQLMSLLAAQIESREGEILERKKISTAGMDAWADAETGDTRFKDGR